MNVIVAGSSGLIGTALVERLTATDHTVTRLVRGPTAARPPRARTTEVTWDPATGTIDLAGLERAGPFDGAVNLAGAGIGDRRWSVARQQLVLDSRLAATSLLVDSLLRLSTPPAVLVNASAVGFYGDRGDEELTEASATGTGFLASVCRAWEAEARPAADAGIRTVLLRTGIVLSPRGGVLGRLLPLFRVGLGGRTGTGKQFRSWITLGRRDQCRRALPGGRRCQRSCQRHRSRPGHGRGAGPRPRRRPAPSDRAGGTGRRPPPAPRGRDGRRAGPRRPTSASGRAVGPGVRTFAHTDLAAAVRAMLDPGR